MALRVALLLATSAYVVSAQPPPPVTCTLADLQTCQNSFNTQLSITEPKPWQDATTFRSKIESLYQNADTLGVRNVCSAFRKFKECLGPCYMQTVQIPFLVLNTNVAVIEATTYLSTYNSLHYMCGGGFSTYIANPTCFEQTWKANREVLENSRDGFEVQAFEHPANACSLANSLLTTFERAFAGGCGPESRDTQFWACEYARTAIFTAFPQCTSSCSLPVVG